MFVGGEGATWLTLATESLGSECIGITVVKAHLPKLGGRGGKRHRRIST